MFGWLSDPAVDVLGERHRAERAGRAVTWYEVLPAAAGEGTRTAVLLASAGRSASDFNRLAGELARAGHRSVLVQPPGIEGSHWLDYLRVLDLEELAADVAAVMEGAGVSESRPAHLVGHAFGNRVARMVATRHGARVASVSLVAAGGKVEIPPEVARSLARCFETWRSADARLPDIRAAFFARDSVVPDTWLRGWYPLTAQLQGEASRATPVERWWRAGDAPLLVLQAVEDRVAPPGNADLLEQELGSRVTRVDVPGAGHALLPEQPAVIAEAILAFIGSVGSAR